MKLPTLLLVALAASCICPGSSRAVVTNAISLLTVKSMDALDNQQKLGPGDHVIYCVIEDQDEPRSLTITDSGHLEVPYLGVVNVMDMTSYQIAKKLKSLLEEKLYYQATVIVAVEQINRTRVTGKVYVTGQVRNRGGFDIPAGEGLTVSKAILNAGGFSDFSDKKHVRLVRKGKEGQQTFIINVQDVWEKSKLQDDLLVQAGDLIVVPARLLNY